MTDKDKAMTELRRLILRIAHLEAAKKRMEWDQEVSMPSGASQAMAETIGSIAEISHQMFVSEEFEDVLMRAREFLAAGVLSPEEECIVRETVRDFDSEKKLPSALVVELAMTASENQAIWHEARRTGDFKMFLPNLKKAFELMRQKAECLGYEKSPYDALMNEYSRGMTCGEVSEIFAQLKDFLMPFVARIADSKVVIRRDFLGRSCHPAIQYKFARRILRKIGFDFNRGRLDKSVHPMSCSFHPTDVRISTRYKRHDLINQCIGSVIHEAGHGMTDQGLIEEYFGTPMGELDDSFMDLHESQSRLWETAVGQSRSFWVYFFPRLQKAFPGVFGDVSLEEFYRAINYVKPSLIRVDADEVTYNLHVILRFEMEREITEGNLKVDEDLPHIWNLKIKESLGVDVPNDREGILQDVHWPQLLIGYFPSYTLGNIYMPQICEAAKIAIPDMKEGFTRGKFKPLRDWLRENFHRHGRMYDPKVLIERACGKSPEPSHLIKYITDKYSEIYGL